jgi:transcriptional regulator with XRE-family HTH domain
MPGRGAEVPGLRGARMRLALTQEELAEKSGIGRATIARLETGSRAGMVTLRKLAAALDTTPAALQEASDRPRYEEAA